MIILNETTDKLKIVLTSAVTTNQLRCYVSYKETNATSITPYRNVALTNNTTSITLVDSPSSNNQRIVDYLSVFNKDTQNAEITISMENSSLDYSVIKIKLKPNEKLEYQEGVGFRTIDSIGAEKRSLFHQTSSLGNVLNKVFLSSDDSITNTTLADIEGLSFPVEAGVTYYFRIFICYTSSSTANGSRFTIDGPTAEFMNYQIISTLTAASISTYFGLNAYSLPSTASVSSAAGNNNAIIEGIIKLSNSGTITTRFANETAGGTITAKAGSFLVYQKIM